MYPCHRVFTLIVGIQFQHICFSGTKDGGRGYISLSILFIEMKYGFWTFMTPFFPICSPMNHFLTTPKILELLSLLALFFLPILIFPSSLSLSLSLPFLSLSLSLSLSLFRSLSPSFPPFSFFPFKTIQLNCTTTLYRKCDLSALLTR